MNVEQKEYLVNKLTLIVNASTELTQEEKDYVVKVVYDKVKQEKAKETKNG